MMGSGTYGSAGTVENAEKIAGNKLSADTMASQNAKLEANTLEMRQQLLNAYPGDTLREKMS